MPINKFCATLALVVFSVTAQAAQTIQHWETSNGARVYFIETPDLPMADVRVVFDAGSARDGDKGGLALMTHGLLDEGAGELNADQIAERLEGVGARIGASADRDQVALSLRSLTDPVLLNPALEVFTKVIVEPSFPVDAMARELKQALIGLRNKKQSPSEIADDLFQQALYGSHPYGQPSEGTEMTLPKLTRDDLVAFHQKHYVGKNAVVAIVGAVDKDQAAAIAEQVVGRLPAGEEPPALPEVAALTEAKQIVQSHPSTQTHILMGQPGVKRADPDYFALYVGNHILGGGGLVSRISDEIREKRGLSYSAYSYLVPMRQPGPYVLGLQTRNDATEEALKVLGDTLKQFVALGPTDAELTAAKQNITGGFPLRLAGNAKLVEYIAMVGFYRLSLNSMEIFPKRVNAVTREQVIDAFKRRVKPDAMATVIVGGSGAKQ